VGGGSLRSARRRHRLPLQPEVRDSPRDHVLARIPEGRGFHDRECDDVHVRHRLQFREPSGLRHRRRRAGAGCAVTSGRACRAAVPRPLRTRLGGPGAARRTTISAGCPGIVEDAEALAHLRRNEPAAVVMAPPAEEVVLVSRRPNSSGDSSARCRLARRRTRYSGAAHGDGVGQGRFHAGARSAANRPKKCRKRRAFENGSRKCLQVLFDWVVHGKRASRVIMPNSNKQSGPERRLHPRVQIGGVALMRLRGEKLGEYIVENLSAGGALVAGEGSSDWLAAPAHLTLTFPGVRPIQVTGRIARVQTSVEGHTSIALKFEHVPAYVQDRIQAIVLRELTRWQDPSVLILHDRVNVLSRLAEKLWALDQKVIFARTPLAAMHWLCNLDTNIRALLAASRIGKYSGLETLAVVAENFRKVRRVLVVDE